MSPITNDPDDPRLRNIEPSGMQEAYLVLSDEERAKGFVRPVRRSYIHVGAAGPVYPLRPLTREEQERYADQDYVAFEKYLRNVPADAPYPPYEEHSSVLGRFWRQSQLDNVGKGCGGTTTMGREIAETYARQPNYYGGTFCATCGTHFPVGRDGEFVWVDAPTERVGT